MKLIFYSIFYTDNINLALVPFSVCNKIFMALTVQEWQRNPSLCFTFYQAIIMLPILFFYIFVYIYHTCHMLTNSINSVMEKSKYNFDLFVYLTLWHPSDQFLPCLLTGDFSHYLRLRSNTCCSHYTGTHGSFEGLL